MLWDLVNSFLGSLPQEYDFIKIFGVLFILYIVIKIFNSLIQAIMSIVKGL